ncbi:class I SAM-dependent methyltransferase [Streptantibioticus ferralitis]|uniref:Class I SAM-dependent methyltransferase n=1 Tax=Streptantibioticus ferralitis TaxID=236510 RepID=A0ABT5Z2W5_9ACTN|nr:class I SAM-dependent methyltransferase [Streptantibioticus ferralitis]MDF2258177.1 class I SAM-dependent methyltransferase [Streptantibioticus ferralitis]
MGVSSGYLEAWEGFWRDTPVIPGAAIWDCDSALSAEPHLELLSPYLDAAPLPAVDLGCGSGTQTRYLAKHFGRAYGVDFAAAEVDYACRADPDGMAEFRQLDASDTAAVERLHAELGTANVHMRGVIHQCEAAARPAVAEAVAKLTGERGRAFVVGLLSAAKTVLREIAEGGPPPKLASVFSHGLTPGEVDDAVVPELLCGAGLSVLAQGRIELVMTEYRPDGSRIDLPAQWLVVGRGE